MHRLLPAPKIAAEIRRIRECRAETQAAFAKTCGTSQSRLSEWERAKSGYRFEPETLEKVARAGGVPVSVFYEPTEAGAPLTALDIARLRDQVRGIVEEAGDVLAALDAALYVPTESPAEVAAALRRRRKMDDEEEPEPARGTG